MLGQAQDEFTQTRIVKIKYWSTEDKKDYNRLTKVKIKIFPQGCRQGNGRGNRFMSLKTKIV